MDARFIRAWDEIEARRAKGEPLDRILATLTHADLVGVLAAAGARDPVAANVVATHLLNRQMRAPFLGALLVSATFLAAIFIVDAILTETAFLMLGESSRRGYILAALAAGSAVLSAGMLYAWRGAARWPVRMVARLRNKRVF